jgi:drug/metabolite transporter (DMT)-like permease
MLWAILVLTATLLWSFVNVVDKVAVGKYVKDPMAYLILIGFVAVLPSVLVPSLLGLQNVPLTMVVFSFVSGILYASYTSLFFRSLSICDAPVVANLLLLVPACTTIVGIFLFGEQIEIVAFLGIFCVLGGALLSSTEQEKKGQSTRTRSISKALIFMTISALLTTVDYSLQKYILFEVEPKTLFFWNQLGVFATALALFVFAKSLRNKFSEAITTIPKRILGLAAFGEIVSFSASFLLIFAYSIATLSLSTVLLSTQPIIVLCLVVLVNGIIGRKVIPDTTSRKNILLRTIAIFITFTGIILITLQPAIDLSLPTLPAGVITMSVDQMILLGTLVVTFLSVLALIWQTRLTRIEMHKGGIRHMYDRWLEISKLEIKYPELHKMFMDPSKLKRLESLTPEELRKRALALVLFDQFSMIYHLGLRRSIWQVWEESGLRGVLKEYKPSEIKKRWKEDSKTLYDINYEYIREIMGNPETRKCWAEYLLGETWQGFSFHDEIEKFIEYHKKKENRKKDQETNASDEQ